jgi:hypothetical protein
MDIHQLMENVAVLEKGKYHREGDISILEEPLPENRWQVVYGNVRKINQIEVGFIFSKIGTYLSKVEPVELLKLNYYLQHSKIAISMDNTLCIIAFFDLNKTSAQQAIEIIREVATIGDRLEGKIFHIDNN